MVSWEGCFLSILKALCSSPSAAQTGCCVTCLEPITLEVEGPKFRIPGRDPLSGKRTKQRLAGPSPFTGSLFSGDLTELWCGPSILLWHYQCILPGTPSSHTRLGRTQVDNFQSFLSTVTISPVSLRAWSSLFSGDCPPRSLYKCTNIKSQDSMLPLEHSNPDYYSRIGKMS